MIKLPENTSRVTMNMDNDLIAEIDKFRYKNHFPNFKVALCELVSLGLKYVNEHPEENLIYKKHK